MKRGSWERRHEIANAGGGAAGPIAFRADGRVLAVQVSGFKVQLLDPATCSIRPRPRLRHAGAAGPGSVLRGFLRFSPDGNESLRAHQLRLIHGGTCVAWANSLTALGHPWELPPFDPGGRGMVPPAGEGEPERRGPAALIRIVADLGEVAGAEDRRQAEAALQVGGLVDGAGGGGPGTGQVQ